MLMLLRSWLSPKLLAVLILSLMCLYAHAYTGAQNDHPVTLSGNTTLRSVFKAIKQQTGYAVMYSTAATALNQDEKVTVNFKNTPLDDVLAYLLRGKELEWKYSDDVLVIHKKETAQPVEKKMEVDSTVAPAMITGKVTDVAGAPLPGVTVQVKGTIQGTTTDVNGNFALAKVNNGQTLLVSIVGYETQSIPVKGRRILAQMNMVISKLDETVVIAYGTTTQRLSTGNIATIKAKDIEKQPVNNLLLALQGRVSGLFITQNNGISNGGVTVRIQGQNSLLNGNDPLYVVDGVPISSQLPAMIGSILGTSGGQSGGASVGLGNPLSFINPADIESINVLKDADATAIYGSRAANGAILITTKRGTVGPTRLNINLQQGIGRITRQSPLLNTTQYLEMRREALRNDGLQANPDVDYDLTLWDTTRYTNWQKTLIGNTAQYTQLSADVSGGTPNLQYILGGTYHRETTVFPGSFSDKKVSVHVNINSTSSNQKLNLRFSGNYMVDNNLLPQVDLTSNAMLLEPDAPSLYNKDGTLNWAPTASGISSWINPLGPLQSTYKNVTNNLIANLNIAYQILPGLEFRSNIGYTNLQSNASQKQPLTAIRPELRSTTSRQADYSNINTTSWILEPQLSYLRQTTAGTIDILLGTTIQRNDNNVQSVTGVGFNDDDAMENMNAATRLVPTGSIITQYRYAALFGRINYNWRNKYILNLNIRKDGSSRFGPSSRFHHFASVGGAWVFNEERWMKHALPFLSFGKLRASYGTTGSDQIPDYSYLDLYSLIPSYDGLPYQGIRGMISSRLFNPYLQWEETRKIQTGIDLGFLQERLILNITYQRNRSSNQLVNYKLPGITGTTGIVSNFPATVQNTSWEGNLQATILKNDHFSWTSSINLTIPRNKLVSFPGLANSTYANFYIIGVPLSSVRLFHSTGVDPQTGEYTYVDSEGKQTASPAYPKDMTTLVNPLPVYYSGFQHSINYKGFQLDLLFQFVKQAGPNYRKTFNSILFPGQFFSGFSNHSTAVLSHWQKPGDQATVAAYTTQPGLSNFNISSSDYTYQDASYIRLKNLSLSWQIPTQWCQNAHLQNIRIYLQAQNLFTISAYKQGDPESIGVIASLPPLQVITTGIHINF